MSIQELVVVTKGVVDGRAREDCSKRYSPIYIVTDCFQQLGSLGLDDLGFLLIASVKGQIDELFWVIDHLF